MTENIGYLTPEQIRSLFDKVLKNRGGLTPETVSELAAYYEWDTYTALKCLCCYINCCQALINRKDLQAICEATITADNLRERMKQMEDSKSEENLARVRSERSNLKDSLRSLKNRISVEQMLSSVN